MNPCIDYCWAKFNRQYTTECNEHCDYAKACLKLAEANASVERLQTLTDLGNMRANDYRVMRDRALKAEEENKKLRADVVRFNDLLASYQNVLVPELRAELERVKEKNAGLALALLTECAPNPDCLGDDEWRAIRAELEQMKAERDAAVDCIYKIEGALDCGNDNDWAREHISEWESQKED